MSEPREFWIYKGTSNFCSELEISEESLLNATSDEGLEYIRSKPDIFYDIVCYEDTVEGGIHVIEISALEKLQAERDIYLEALEQLEQYVLPIESKPIAKQAIEAGRKIREE